MVSPTNKLGSLGDYIELVDGLYKPTYDWGSTVPWFITWLSLAPNADKSLSLYKHIYTSILAN